MCIDVIEQLTLNEAMTTHEMRKAILLSRKKPIVRDIEQIWKLRNAVVSQAFDENEKSKTKSIKKKSQDVV